ncbi:DUF983 domain-containing protein [Sphingobacterium sp. SRCM116780]|uniref:DUF983 domain-containing protein n=1 Tax=Sphingobacterium sp. SRCM116780 TaxID=2907623 RepID=UPI001F2043DC|nr:DUF983 domain-containing protein [Sphingobacterium sp. SRCM116780]UIR56545.1 DUF983 domain-containing protein [Sphingobacterium sp. SRCM116780]
MSTSKSYAILHSKCPRCHVGNMFDGPAYSLRKQKMYDTCHVCNLTFEIEPGYFYAAMYVSYAMSVTEVVTFAVATAVISGSESPWTYLLVLCVTIIIFAPFNYRYSRLVLLHLMTPKISYDPKWELQYENKNKSDSI